MVETNDRRLPVGIQSFEEIRKDGYLYVDKTDIIWQLANRGKKYNYLSRPRRFGKSVLVDTLEAYFMGKKELFEGLKIMQLETEWVKRPVIRLDMSRAGAEPETLRSYLDITFDKLEEEYGITPKPTAKLADRFNAIIVGAYEQTGQRLPSSSMNTTLHCSIPGRLLSTKHVPLSIERFLPFSRQMTNTRSLSSSPASPSSRKSRFSLCSII